MQRKIKGYLALLMSLMMLVALLPTAAFTESDVNEFPVVMMEQTMDDEEPPDFFEETEEETYTEDEPWVDWADDAPTYETYYEMPFVESIEGHIADYGYAYVVKTQAAVVYSTSEMTDPIYTIAQDGAILLATEYRTQNGKSIVKVWFITEENEAIAGHVEESALADTVLWDDEAVMMALTLWSGLISSDVGEQYAFVVKGAKPGTVNEAPTVIEIAPTEDSFINHTADEDALPGESTDNFASEPIEEPAPGETGDNGEPDEEAEDDTDTADTEEPAPDVLLAEVGDYIAVSPTTRAFLGIDETASDEYAGALSLGVFINDAVVQVVTVEQDSHERYWYKARYIYGDDYVDGTMKWVEDGFIYALASETDDTAEQECSVTDYAYSSVPSPKLFGIMALAATPMPGFSLKTINAPIPSLYAGQTGVYGSSGRDSEYPQIATLPGHGTIYATPHYLNGFTVYCLEHNLPGPGERISGGGTQPTGPYVIVDIDTYRNTPGYSSIIFREQTLHAIAWVLRHTYPFMVLDRSDSNNETWSRVAGQFAIREVIKQMEGAQYVRDYWHMENFYAASGQAPAAYLAYARWLAENGIARGQITGAITIAGKSVSFAGGVYTGTATLTTDADLIRISRSVGNLTGNTAGQDGSYYFLNSGDTITVSSASNPFTIVAESINSDAEEAGFLVGVPTASIQKVLIPTYGYPYKMQSASILFEIPYGSISVTKKDAKSGSILPGATFDLLNSAGVVVQTLTTGSSGIVTFINLQPGSYSIREKTAPEGYYVATPDTQNVTVAAGNVSNVSFTNNIITAKIRIVKIDQLTKVPLSGVEFTVTRLSAPASHNGAGVGQVVAVITTDAGGIAETGWLDWGRYRVDETKVPAHYVDNHFSTIIEAYENGKTYTIEVENEPTKGWIRLTKTDRQNGNPIEGVRFDIYYNDQYGTGLAGSMVTDKDGIAISSPLRKGKYIVKEHGETVGYIFEEITLDATVKSDETTELEASNRHVTIKLKLYKRDAEEYDGENINPPSTRGDGVLIGAEFQVLAGEDITDRQGNVIHAKGSVVVESLTTAGEDVSVTTDELWPGLYEIVELKPPVGYQPSDASIFVDARSAALQSQEAIVTYEGLKTNTVLYGALAIVKFLGDNMVHAGAGIIETPEEGAEFEIYLKSAGSYENARDVERDYLITDQYGRAQTKALPYGVYVLRQIVGKEGHAIMNPIDFMIDGTENLQYPPTLTLNNQALRYRLRIIKIDEETGNTVALANTAFRLRDGDGNTVKQSVNYPVPMELDIFLTDENGEVTLPETVVWGQYFVEEVQSPDGYLIRSDSIIVFVGHAGDAADEVSEVTVEFPNVPVKGHIVLDKKGLQLVGFETMTDTYGNTYHKPIYQEGYLEGAVFEVRAVEDIIGKDGTVWYRQGDLVDTITTTASGSDRSIELPLGRYCLVEIQAPAGYVFDDTQYEAHLVFADNMTAKVETTIAVGNEYLPAHITLKKEKEITQVIKHEAGVVRQTIANAPGEGFVFGLYNDDDIRYSGGTLMADTLVATDVTDAYGNLTFSDYYPHGWYYIKELSAPKGWKLNPQRFEITLDPAKKSEGVIRISLPEAVHDELIYTPITLTKTDITGEKTIPGCVIEVKNSDGEIIYRAATDESGHIPDIPITPGTYTFREVLAPEGYALNEAVMTFTVDESGNITGDNVIRDDFTRFSILKHDGSEQPLTGVEFALVKEDGSLLYNAVSDENGLVTFEKVPYGNYTIIETQPLPGYVQNDTEIQLTVDGYFINPSEPVATLVNRRFPTDYEFVKTDHEGIPLAGVKFTIEDEDGNVFRDLVSGEDGIVHVTDLEPGVYVIREIETLEGFIRTDETIQVVIDEHYTVPDEMFQLINYPGIQTGVDFTMTPVMWGGVAMMLAAAALVGVYGMKNKKRKRRPKCRR